MTANVLIFVADGITTMFLMADVIAIMADGIAMYFLWQMELPHCFNG